jgi:hypothetical protein
MKNSPEDVKVLLLDPLPIGTANEFQRLGYQVFQINFD